MQSLKLTFQNEERDLILEVLPELDPVIRRKLSLCEWQNKRLVASLATKELAELLHALDEEIARQPRQIRRNLESIKKHLVSQSSQPSEGAPSHVTSPEFSESGKSEDDGLPTLRERIQQELDNWDGRDHEAMNRKIQAMAEQYNRTPQKELGDLSPEQMHRLLYSGVDRAGAVIHFNADLSLEDLESSELLVNARLLLRLLNESGGTKATASGYLNRAFIRQVMDEVIWPSESWDDFLDIKKRVNELDLYFIHVLRILMGISGLIRKYKGKFIISKKGRGLLAPDMAGELFRTLFYTFLVRFNQGYLGMGIQPLPIQDTYNYTLYRLHNSRGEWIKQEDFLTTIVLPTEEEGESAANDLYENRYPDLQIQSQIITPLHRFGLIELRHKPHEHWPKATVLDAIRTTPLFVRFIRFELDSSI